MVLTDAFSRPGREDLVLRSRPVGEARADQVGLSVGQAGVWGVREVVGPGALFSVGLGLRTGVLDRGALGAALAAVTARHEPLRSRVVAAEGGPVQVADGAGQVRLEDLGAAGGVEEAVVLAAAFRDQPFDLGQGPVWRAGLIGLPDTGSVLVLAADRLACDVRSLQVLLTELGLLYEDFAAGRAPRLAPLAVRYRDFVRWQQQATGGPSFTAQLGYWRRQLAGLAPLELPCDHVRPARPSTQGASWGFAISPQVAAQLRAIAARERVTLFMVLLAAFQVLLGRHAGQEDVAVGTLVPGRDRPEFEPLIGLFENPVVLRTDLSADPSFTGLLARVRQTTISAFSNQAVPFGQVTAQAATASPLYQVMFTLRAGLARSGLRRLGGRPLRLPHTTADCDLSLEITNPNDQLWGSFRYNTAIFTRPTIQRLAERFTTLLADITTNPHKPIKELGSPDRMTSIYLEPNERKNAAPGDPRPVTMS
jgi:Condensation domain